MTNPKDLVGSKKAPLGLVPPALEIGAAEAMANGAEKYGPYNWREEPVQYMPYLAAMKRHINALIDGEDLAADSHIHHLKHIVSGGAILLDSIGLGILIDDRPPKGPAAKLLHDQDKSRPAPTELCRAPAGTYDGIEGGRPHCPVPCPHEGDDHAYQHRELGGEG